MNIKPEKLITGDTIGVVAPAGAFDEVEFFNGIKIIKELGFRVNYSDSVFDKNGYFAGSDKHRADSFNQMINNPEVKAVICARGGYGSMKILDLIDFHRISESGKMIIGFSDITALLVSISEVSGVVTFHGPVVTSLEKSDDETIKSFDQTLRGHNDFLTKLTGGSTIIAGKTSGVVTGGNLATLCHLTGTEYQPDLNGKILLIEDIAEPLYKIDRMLTQMMMAGYFEGLSGVILGTFEKCGDTKDVHRLFESVLSGIGIPTAGDFNIGHGTSNLTIPIGAYAEFDSERGLLEYL